MGRPKKIIAEKKVETKEVAKSIVSVPSEVSPISIKTEVKPIAISKDVVQSKKYTAKELSELVDLVGFNGRIIAASLPLKDALKRANSVGNLQILKSNRNAKSE